ncbi:GAF domain-containing protein [Sphingomonas lenta]|nr:GAF domain-containing protein [Sphingomonas lenta]
MLDRVGHHFQFGSAAALKLWLSETLVHETDPVTILRVTAEAVGRFLRVTRIGYGDVEPGEDWMTIPLDWTDGIPSLVGRIPIYRENAFVQAYQQGRTMTVSDVRLLDLPADEAAMLEQTFCRACISVPLVHEGELVALFSATHREPRDWTAEEVELVEYVGARTWAALRHARAVARLKESEEQFRQLAENFPGICWLAGPDGLGHWMNARGLEFYGADGLPTAAAAVVHPDDLASATGMLDAALTGGRAVEGIVRVRGSDGMFHPFLSRMVPIHDAEGAIARWCGVQVDLTEKHSRDRHEAFFRHVSEAIREETDAARILDIAADALREHLDVTFVVYSEAQEMAGVFANLHGAAADPSGDWDDNPIQVPAEFAPLLATLAEGRTVVSRDLHELTPIITPQVRDFFGSRGVRSGVSVPLVKDGRLVVILSAQHESARDWTPEEVRLVEELAERTWSTYSRAQAEAALAERERHQRFLVEWSDALRDQRSVPDILSVTLERLAEQIGVARANYSEVAQDARSFTILAEHRCDEAAAVTVGNSYQIDQVGADIWRRFSRGDVVGSDDVEADRLIDEAAREAYRRRTVGAFLSVPLVREGKVRAVFSVQHRRSHHWTDGEIRLLRDVADRAWVALERARAEAALTERERHGRFLIEWSDSLRERTSASAIMAITLERLATHLDASRANYGERDEADGLFVTAAEWRRDGVRGSMGVRYRIEEVGAAIHGCFAAGEVVRCDDVETDPRIDRTARAFHRENGVGAFVSVPLVREGRVCAVLSVKEPGPRVWREDEVRLMHEVADRAWVVLERARAETALKERERNQAFLLAWSDAVRAETSPEAIVDVTIERLGLHLGAARANYAEGDEAGGRFEVVQEWRRDAGPDGGFVPRREAVSDGVHHAYLTGDVVVVDDVHADDRFEAAAARAYAAVDAVSFLGVPMVRGGRVRAVLSVQHGRAHRWRPAEVQLIREVADRTWTMLERARAEAALKEREREQAFVIGWSDAVRNESGPRAVLAATLDRLGRHLGAGRVNYAETTQTGDEFEVIQEWTQGAVRLAGRRFPFAALGSRVVADHMTGRPLVVNDVTTHPLFDLSSQSVYASAEVRSGVSVPLLVGGRLQAVLSVMQPTPRAWNESEVRLICEIADRTWATLERARFEERMAESEALLATFMENAPIGMHLKDADGRYIRVNQELAHAIGRPREDILGRRVAEIMAPEIACEVERLERQAMAGQRVSAELARERHDGRYAAALSIAFPIEGHGLARTGGFTIDLTDRKAAETALQRSREALYQTEKLSALGSLLAGVSHELNNPLSIVVAQAVMMERQAAGTELADRAFKIRRAADRCARIVQTFLAMARAKRPEREPVDLNAVAVAALDLADYGLRTDGVAVERRLAADLPRIAADADQLHQVIINLVVNAQHAMKEAGTHDRRLVLTTARGPEPDTVVLDVSDNGPGVPEELKRRIFEPFFTTKPQGEGTGVGLSFSQGLAEAHGGRLALLPTEMGATFRLTLPIDVSLTLPRVEPETARPSPVAARRALVVDDEREIAESLADFLSVEGYKCEIAIGGAAAKERLGEGRYDLIVSDLRMPDVDGPELHAWIAAARPDLAGRMAFTTGDTLGAAAERFLKSAHRPVLEKPFTPESVRALIERVDAGA